MQDLLPVTVAPVYTAIQEASVSHTLAVNLLGLPTKKGVGQTNQMQAISCGKKCLWNMGSKIAMDDLHFSIELDQLKGWIDDVHAVLDADLWHNRLKCLRVLSPGEYTHEHVCVCCAEGTLHPALICLSWRSYIPTAQHVCVGCGLCFFCRVLIKSQPLLLVAGSALAPLHKHVSGCGRVTWSLSCRLTHVS